MNVFQFCTGGGTNFNETTNRIQTKQRLKPTKGISIK